MYTYFEVYMCIHIYASQVCDSPKHDVHDAANAPHVHCNAVPLTAQNLWCNISVCACHQAVVIKGLCELQSNYSERTAC